LSLPSFRRPSLPSVSVSFVLPSYAHLLGLWCWRWVEDLMGRQVLLCPQRGREWNFFLHCNHACCIMVILPSALTSVIDDGTGASKESVLGF
jgi:hypothetical protein